MDKYESAAPENSSRREDVFSESLRSSQASNWNNPGQRDEDSVAMIPR